MQRNTRNSIICVLILSALKIVGCGPSEKIDSWTLPEPQIHLKEAALFLPFSKADRQADKFHWGDKLIFKLNEKELKLEVESVCNSKVQNQVKTISTLLSNEIEIYQILPEQIILEQSTHADEPTFCRFQFSVENKLGTLHKFHLSTKPVIKSNIGSELKMDWSNEVDTLAHNRALIGMDDYLKAIKTKVLTYDKIETQCLDADASKILKTCRLFAYNSKNLISAMSQDFTLRSDIELPLVTKIPVIRDFRVGYSIPGMGSALNSHIISRYEIQNTSDETLWLHFAHLQKMDIQTNLLLIETKTKKIIRNPVTMGIQIEWQKAPAALKKKNANSFYAKVVPGQIIEFTLKASLQQRIRCSGNLIGYLTLPAPDTKGPKLEVLLSDNSNPGVRLGEILLDENLFSLEKDMTLHPGVPRMPDISKNICR